MKYTDEDLIEELKRVRDEYCNGEKPNFSDMEDYGDISTVTFQRRFGSWSNALEQIDYNTKREKLIEEMKRLSEEMLDGKRPKQKHMIKYGKYSKSQYYTVFGSWKESVKAAGFEARSSKIYEEELVEEIQRVSDEYFNSEPPKFYEWVNNDDTKFSATAYVNRFGDWTTTLKETGFSPHQREYSDEELIEILQNISSEEEYVTQEKLESGFDITAGMYINRFGSWNNALEEAGLEVRDRGEWSLSGDEHPHWKGGVSFETYGPNWHRQRTKCLERDERKCAVCHSKPLNDCFDNPDVHHITPKYYWDVDEEYETMNNLRNLICLCRSCHRKLEGKFKGRNYEEFKSLGKEELGIDEEPERGSVFDY